MVKKDTIYSAKKDSQSLLSGLCNPIIHFYDFDYLVCSEHLVDSNKNWKAYKILQLNQHIYYRKTFQSKHLKLVKCYDQNYSLLSTDSILLHNGNKNKHSYFTSYYQNEENEVAQTKFWYYINGQLKKTERVTQTDSHNYKFVSEFTPKGEQKKIQYFQFEPTPYDKNKFEWILIEESTFRRINSELTIEKQKNRHIESESTIYLYKGENYSRRIEKTGCLIKTVINQKL
ncbi:hypothetical protein [Aureispira anguillae]|nr:hypothetical protein [Aureispira anguillae]